MAVEPSLIVLMTEKIECSVAQVGGAFQSQIVRLWTQFIYFLVVARTKVYCCRNRPVQSQSGRSACEAATLITSFATHFFPNHPFVTYNTSNQRELRRQVACVAYTGTAARLGRATARKDLSHCLAMILSKRALILDYSPLEVNSVPLLCDNYRWHYKHKR
jgi:hypothetical protein